MEFIHHIPLDNLFPQDMLRSVLEGRSSLKDAHDRILAVYGEDGEFNEMHDTISSSLGVIKQRISQATIAADQVHNDYVFNVTDIESWRRACARVLDALNDFFDIAEDALVWCEGSYTQEEHELVFVYCAKLSGLCEAMIEKGQLVEKNMKEPIEPPKEVTEVVKDAIKDQARSKTTGQFVQRKIF